MKQLKLIRFIVLFFVCIQAPIGFSQVWEEIGSQTLRSIEGTREITPVEYRTYKLDVMQMTSFLQEIAKEGSVSLRQSPSILEVPLPDGKIERFHVVQYAMVEQALAERYPTFKTVLGISTTNPNRRIRMDWTQRGFRGMITDPGGRIFIDPVFRENQEFYQVYHKSDFQDTESFKCEVDFTRENAPTTQGQRSGDCVFRSYRLVVATTGEYSNYFNATSSADEATVLSEVMTAVNRVNDVYEADVTVRLILIANTADVFYYDGSTDPYTNGNGSTMLGENQTNCNTVIGSANYDIGHVFSTGGGGVATLFGPCGSNKARGVTGQNAPVNDPFYIDYVAHEMGHQFGANHTQNNSCNRNGSTAMEPGSASTIMGYAGICNPNVQSNSDAYFHGISVQEINNFISNGNGNSCDTPIPFVNTAPSVVDQGNYTIPISTPFMLTADAMDPEGNPILYCWEQWDNEVGTMPPQSTNSQGPMFRSFLPESSPTRYFPRLSDLVTNTDFDWEELPSVTRDMEFRATIRDFVNGVGCTTEDNLIVTTDDAAGPFEINSPGVNVTWVELQTVTIDWNVANTDASPVNCSNVDILLSYDGGFTYPATLATSVPNDGLHDVSIPPGITAQGRVMVKCSDNIFFDISNEDIVIDLGVPDYSLSSNDTLLEVCSEDQVTYLVDVNSVAGYIEPVNLVLNGAPAGTNPTITPNPVIPGNQVSVQLNNLQGVTNGTYLMQLTGTSISGTKTLPLKLVKPLVPATATLLLPLDEETGVNSNPFFDWSDASAASRYTLEVANDQNFTTPTIIQDILSTSYQSILGLDPLTTYYWRVRGVNDCFEGTWSQVFSFTTRPCFTVQSSDTPIDISAGPPSTITSTINLPNTGTIDDVNVSLDISHTWIGDLEIELTSPASQTVMLLDRICGNSDDILMILDDEAPNSNYPCPATDGNAYQPDQLLSLMDGATSYGDWVLTVRDRANQDGGILNSWSLEVCILESCQLNVDNETGSTLGTLIAAVNCATNGDTIFFDQVIEGDTVFLPSTIVLSKDLHLLNTNAQAIYITTDLPERVFEVTNGVSLGLENVVILGKGLSPGSALLNEGTVQFKNASVRKLGGTVEPLILNTGQMDFEGNCSVDQ